MIENVIPLEYRGMTLCFLSADKLEVLSICCRRMNLDPKAVLKGTDDKEQIEEVLKLCR